MGVGMALAGLQYDLSRMYLLGLSWILTGLSGFSGILTGLLGS